MHNLQAKNLISISHLTERQVDVILNQTTRLKEGPRCENSLNGKTLAMLFEQPSTRTRVSFEVGMYQLGGLSIQLSPGELQMSRGEAIKDTAMILSRYVDAIVARTRMHKTLLDLARYSSVPVINGLTDTDHPCQVLSDLFTIREKKGYLRGIKLAYIGDGNNVLHSLLQGCAKTGVHISYATPKGYEPVRTIVNEAMEVSKHSGSKIVAQLNPADAVNDADLIYTDVWISMGKEKEKARRLKAFNKYQLNKKLLSKAKQGALVMHCLPAHRGQEITDEVMDGNSSIIFDQAENRLHTHKAILKLLLT